ncbi:EAL domain-containing protein [Pseudoduganella sp. GCM10020061]|uniref:bifunctional diguanylate cyclase/phosphodiesterase n=1 Tax=Pseudoduganella sp. GCM10020061 TaxID=3317345 RepID=UPI003637EE84
MTAAAPAVPAEGGWRARAQRWLRQGRETHISLPLFALVLLCVMWAGTFRMIDGERAAAVAAARDSARELIDTYEAQVGRNLNGIDQTLRVLRYAVELEGAQNAIPMLEQRGMLPPSLVFQVKVIDRHGVTVASNFKAPASDMAERRCFNYHRDHPADEVHVSHAASEAENPEPHLHFTRRIDDAQGRFAGIVVLEVDPAYFTSGYERSRQGEQGLLGLVGEDAVFRVRRSGDSVTWGQRVPRLTPGESLARGTHDGVLRFLNARKMHGFPLYAAAGLGYDEQLAAFEQARSKYLLAAGGASVALAMLVSVVCVWSWQAGRTRRRIRRAQERYAAASEASLDAFFVLRTVKDAGGKIVDFMVDATNSRAEAMTGFGKNELIGKTLLTLLPDARGGELFDDLVHAATVGGVHEAERKISFPLFRPSWVHRQVVGVEGGIVCIVRDITERKRSEARILQMAHYDELTGLPNRNMVGQRLEQEIARAQREGAAMAVAFIDLDGFKLVNDGLGHKAGDELLCIVGTRMQQCLGGEAMLGRFGGDEFVLVLPGVPDTMAAAPVLESLRQAVAQPVMLGEHPVRVSASIGAVMYPHDGLDPTTLMMNADAAMYRAKELGSNNIQFYTREMNSSLEQKLLLLDGLRGALEAGQFSVLYQPKVDLRTGRIFGVEALVRWHHPEHGHVSPAQFIPLAEESGLIVQLGEWVLQTACAQSKAWRDAGLPPVTMSVNVSARQFAEDRLVERVAEALRVSGLPADGLEIEVTESLIMRDMQQSIERMRELKAMGVSLSVDDFGTGYSSLSALKSFPISTLKIDKSFVSDLATSTDDQAIAMAVISLGHKLNLRVIAEGVETEQQYRFLLENDCDEMQGYLFSRPVRPAELAVMLSRSARMASEGKGWSPSSR